MCVERQNYYQKIYTKWKYEIGKSIQHIIRSTTDQNSTTKRNREICICIKNSRIKTYMKKTTSTKTLFSCLLMRDFVNNNKKFYTISTDVLVCICVKCECSRNVFYSVCMWILFEFTISAKKNSSANDVKPQLDIKFN